jgi:uncharacterized membrane protein
MTGGAPTYLGSGDPDRRRWGTGRTEAFSDGVFAIAITLLVLDIAIPESELHHLSHGIFHAWPAYLAFVTSFLTVGAIWLGHHGIFRRLEHINTRVMRVNLLLLLLVSFVPFPTRLMAQSIRDSGAERAAVIFYGLTLAAVFFAFAALWASIMRDRQLLKPEVGEEEIRAVGVAVAPNVGLVLGATALAIVAPRVAAFGYLSFAVVAVLRAGPEETATAGAVPPGGSS